MTWAANDPQVWESIRAEAIESGSCITLRFEGSTYDLIPRRRVGYDFVVSVENDETVRGFGALRRALHVLGIDIDYMIVRFDPKLAHGAWRSNKSAPRRYAVVMRVLGDQAGSQLPPDELGEDGFQAGDDTVVRLELGSRADEQHSHDSSPSAGGCGDPSLGERGAGLGPLAGPAPPFAFST